MSDIVERLRLGISISRDRGLNLDFVPIATEAADTIEALRRERDDAVNSMRVALEVQHIREEQTMMDKYGYKS